MLLQLLGTENCLMYDRNDHFLVVFSQGCGDFFACLLSTSYNFRFLQEYCSAVRTELFGQFKLDNISLLG